MSIRNQAREVVLKIKRKDTSPHVVADYKSFEATETFALHKVSKEAEAREAEDIEINSKIPDAASALNKLADHDWVVELVNSESAYYITSNAAGDAFATREALESAEEYWSGGEPRTPTRNDYAVVQDYEGTQWRFIYAVPRVTTEVSDTESDSESSEVPTGHWEPQYPIETNDYDGLSNKPSINGVELVGDKSAAELGIELDRIVSPNGKTVVVVKDEGKAALEKKITEQCTGWVISNRVTGAEIATLTDSSSEIQEGYLVEKWTGKDTEGQDVALAFIWQGDTFVGGSVRIGQYTYARIDEFTDDTHTKFNVVRYSGEKKQVEVIRWESATILTEDDNITELVSPDGNTVVSADNDGTAKVAHTTTSFGNATVHFPEGFSITEDSASYTAPSGGESIEFYGPIESSLFPSDRFWVPYEYKDTSDFDPNQAVWCFTTVGSSLELMFKAGPFFSVSDWDSAAPTLTLGMGETTGDLPTMTRALTPSTVTKTVATTDQIPEVPAVVPPSTSATTGQAADAKATGEALSLNAVEPSAWSVSPEYTYAVVVNYEGSSLGWMFGFQHPHPQPTDWVSANNTDPDATLLQCEYGGTTYTATVKGGYRLGPDSTSNPNRDKMLASQADMATLRNRVSDIERVIPSDASSDNQLADKSYVNTAVATSSATFLGTSEAATKAEFETWLETLHADNNDYVFWQTVNSEGNTVYKRYKYSDFDDSSEGYSGPLPSSDFPITWDGGRVDLADADTLIWGTWGDGGKVLKTADELVICYFDADGLCRLRPDQVIRDLAFAGSPAVDGEWPVLDEDGSDSSDEPLAGHWLFEYELNNTSFTPEQWDAINSGIVGVVDPSPDALPGLAASAAGTSEATTLKARWVIVEGDLPEDLQMSIRYSEAAGEWFLTVTTPDGTVIGEFPNTGGEGPDAASVTFDTREYGTLVVSRRGLILGSQDETPIASEAEAEELRTAVALNLRGPNHDGLSAWNVQPVYPAGYTAYVGPVWNDAPRNAWSITFTGDPSGEEATEFAESGNTKTSLSVGFPSGTTATRTALPGYILGPDDPSNPNRDKPLASDANVVHKTGNEEMTGPLFMVGTSVRLQSSNKKTTVAFSYASITHTMYGSSSMTWGYPKSSGTLVVTAIAKTWSELNALRDGGNLAPGQQYRITDYVATTNGDMESQSANHPFDIIVTADDNRTLNEHARAIMHETVLDFSSGTQYAVGDFCKYEGTVYKCVTAHKGAWTADDFTEELPYFYNCNLAAWDVWYCLDNDANRFAWATANGKGVVYRLVDEFQNDCPYDFKGIQFKANGSGATDVWRYTFDSGASSGNTDLSLAGFAKSVFKNTIAPYPKSASGFKWALNRIVFKGSSCYSNTFGSGCYSNTFGSSCQFNTFDLGCYSNTFGSSCKFNTFGPDCHNNAFSSSCQFNTFGSGCDYNTFGLGCTYITFSSNCTYNTIDSKIGSKCSYITLGSGCDYNTFGSGCTYNKLGSECNRNTFGSSCRFNTFGPGCDYNTFGVNCHNNAFGSGCHHNTFGVNCYDNTFGTDCHCNTFGTGCYVGDWLVDSQQYVGTVVGYDGVLYPVLRRYRGSFLTTQTYLVGETLYCDSQYWECTTEHSGAWTAAHFAPLGPRPFGSILPSSSDKYVPRSYYRGVELEDGVSYTALDCTADRGNGVYYQNVMVSKGISGTGSAPKHIEDTNYSQTSKTTYQPAGSQVISI